MARKSGQNREDRSSRIATLKRTLREAENELKSLIDEQDGGLENGEQFLLKTQALLQETESVGRRVDIGQIDILNALPAHIALLDNEGVIVAVNEAWRRFATANALNNEDYCVGQNYVSICEDAYGESADEAPDVARGIRDVLRGAKDEFDVEYPCHAPYGKRWFRLVVSPLTLEQNPAALVMHMNVTEKRLTEEALNEREHQNRLLAEESVAETRRLLESQAVARIGSWETNLETLDVTWSAETYRIFEVSPTDFDNQHLDFLQYVHPDDRQALDRAFLESFSRDGTSTIRHRICLRDDSVKHIEERWIIHKDSAGKAVRAFGTCQDISEAVHAQLALSDSEDRFRSLFEQAAVGMVIASESGRFLRVNQRFANIIGYSKDEIVGKLCAETTHVDDRSFEAHAISEMLAGTRTDGSWQKRYLRKDGSSVWCTLTLAPLNLKDGVKQLIGVIEDISEKKQAEDSARQNQAMLRIAGDVARIGGWVVDLEQQDVQWSDEVRAIHEVEMDFQPTLKDALEFYPEEHRRQVTEAVNLCIADGIPFNSEFELITAKGRRIWILTTGEAVRDDAGRVVRLQGAFQDITERKVAEASLAESQRRFRAMADSFPFIVWTADEDGQVNYANRRFFEYAGLSSDADMSKNWKQTVHPEDLPHALNLWKDAVRSGRSYRAEFRLLHDATGDYRWHHVQAEPVPDHEEGIVIWNGTGIDIDETKALQRESTRLATRLNDTLESITDGFFVLDINWKFTFINMQAERLLEEGRVGLIGENFWQHFPEFVGSEFQLNCEKAVREKTAVHLEEYYLAPLDRWFDISAYPGEEGLALYLRDVTEEREASAHLRLLEAAVARLNDLVVITKAEPLDDPGPSIVFVNDAFERRTGYTRAEVIGKTPRLLQGAKTQRKELARIRDALSTWQPVRAELINYTKAGEEFWIEIDIVPLANEKGILTHWVAVERDVTERHRLSEQLRQSQRLESIGQLTGGLAHDFNNLMTVILSNGELLLEQLSDPELGELVEMVTGAAQHGAALTQRLLAFARLQPLSPKAVDVNRLISGMEPLLRRTLGEHIEIRFNSSDLWPAMIDSPQLESAILNLCMNSRDAMPMGGSLTIETANVHLDKEYTDHQTEVKPGQYIMIAVSDTGSGMKKETVEQVFEPFFTTKEPGKGTGLGLAMLYGFLKQSGGHVVVSSEYNVGTTVNMYLPKANETPAAGQATYDAAPEMGGDEKILLVEDNELVLRSATKLLKTLGYQVRSVSNPVQALEILHSDEALDLLFTDVVMPEMSGKELAKEALRIRPSLRVLYSSGYTEEAIVDHGRLDPNVHLLSKPYRISTMAKKLREVLDS